MFITLEAFVLMIIVFTLVGNIVFVGVITGLVLTRYAVRQVFWSVVSGVHDVYDDFVDVETDENVGVVPEEVYELKRFDVYVHEMVL